MPCGIKGTLTVSDASKRELGLKKAKISSFELSFPKSQKESRFGFKQKTIDFGLSKSVKRKLEEAKSVAITLRATYTRGGSAPERAARETFTLTQKRLKPDHSSGNGLLEVQSAPEALR